jgi:hypothetical protein
MEPVDLCSGIDRFAGTVRRLGKPRYVWFFAGSAHGGRRMAVLLGRMGTGRRRGINRNRSAYPHAPTAPAGGRQSVCPGQAGMRSSGTTTPAFTQFLGIRSSVDALRTQVRTRTSASQASGFTPWS